MDARRLRAIATAQAGSSRAGPRPGMNDDSMSGKCVRDQQLLVSARKE
jgi:hypothetical protein